MAPRAAQFAGISLGLSEWMVDFYFLGTKEYFFFKIFVKKVKLSPLLMFVFFFFSPSQPRIIVRDEVDTMWLDVASLSPPFPIHT